jgi:hypothetical protein
MYEATASREVKEMAKIPVKEETIMPEPKRLPDLFINREEGITSLFSLYYRGNTDKRPNDTGVLLSLESFDLAPEYYITLKRPFLLKTIGDVAGERYLLIISVNETGAICLDKEGNQREIEKGFLFENWGKRVSWIFPVSNDDQVYNIGMEGPAISRIQKSLQTIGYMVDVTGIYDTNTFNEMKRFQGDFGLRVDGIAGPRTKALLYQMVE